MPTRWVNNIGMAEQIYLSLWLDAHGEDSMLEAWGKLLEAFPASAAQPGVRGLAVIPFSWSETAVLEQVYGEGESIEATVEAAREFLHADYVYQAAMRWDVWRLKTPDELAETDMEALVDDEFRDDEDAGEPDDEDVDLPSGAREPSGSTGNETLSWKRVPLEVAITCLGPEFDQGTAGAPVDQQALALDAASPHFRIDLGLDTLFLPDEQAIESAESNDNEDWEEAGLCYRDNIAQLLGFIGRIEKALPLKSRQLWSAAGDDLGERIRQAYTGS